MKNALLYKLAKALGEADCDISMPGNKVYMSFDNENEINTTVERVLKEFINKNYEGAKMSSLQFGLKEKEKEKESVRSPLEILADDLLEMNKVNPEAVIPVELDFDDARKLGIPSLFEISLYPVKWVFPSRVRIGSYLGRQCILLDNNIPVAGSDHSEEKYLNDHLREVLDYIKKHQEV